MRLACLEDRRINSLIVHSDHSPVNTSVQGEEEGLPSPPMDEGALLVTQTTIQLSEVKKKGS